MGIIEFKLKTLTPLWTGGADSRHMDRVHETGIVGSLRWWYEATLRALGKHVCDSTAENSDERCRLGEGSRPLCDACRLFGATGQSRRFRVRLEGGATLFQGNHIPLPSGRLRNNLPGGWYLEGESRIGDLTLRVVPLGLEDEAGKLRIPLALIHRYAALGAKVSNGYGVVAVTEENGAKIAVDPSLLVHLAGGGRKGQPSSDLPDLRDFFFAKLMFQAPSNDSNWWQKIRGIADAFSGQVTDQGQTRWVFKNRQEHNEAKNTLGIVVQQHGVVPLAPAVRNWLRYKLQWPSGLTEQQKTYLFGTTNSVCPQCYSVPDGGRFREDRRNPSNYWCFSCKRSFPKNQAVARLASKINVSHAYRLDSGDWEFRIWGWIPCTPLKDSTLSLERDRFLQEVNELLSDTKTDWTPAFGEGSPIRPTLAEWHSLDCNDRDGMTYLNELLGLTVKAGAS